MMYLLDTDHITLYHRRGSNASLNLIARMATIKDSEFAYSIISFQEQLLGTHAFLRQARNTAQLCRGYEAMLQFLNNYRNAVVLPYDLIADTIFSSFPATCQHIGTMDQRIAAIALAHDLTLLTRNRNDFQKVPGLRIDDWTV